MVNVAVKEYFSEIMGNIEKGIWPNDFRPEPKPWFPGHDERCIEVPWALSCYQGQKKILEIGLCLADLSLVLAQVKLKQLAHCQLSGLDIVDLNRVKSRFTSLGFDISEYYNFRQADARDTGFSDDSFDLIFLISTLEHFGFDAFQPDKSKGTVFKRPKDYPGVFPVYAECFEDRKAIKEIARILSPNGSLLITLPFSGRGICALQDSRGLWALYKEYTLKEWRSLVSASGLSLVSERFFKDAGKLGWVEEKNPEALSQFKGSPVEPTKSIVCAELKR